MRRALFTLIKRQIIDNAIYFVFALAVSFVVAIATITVALTEHQNYLSPYATALLLAVPIFFCVGSYTLGLVQTYADRASGVAAILSVLPIARVWILLARLIVGALVILTALGPLAIVGVVLWKFMGPPAWLFHGWIADVFLGAVLTAFACYCLGLHAGGQSETFVTGLRALPLTIILLFLIIIKGFGSPLLVVLVPFAILAFVPCWKPMSSRIVTNITLGLMVLILLAVPLHLGRYLCDGLLVSKIYARAGISPLGLLPSEVENDPNVEKHSTASSGFSFFWSWNRCIARRFIGSHFYEFNRNLGQHILENPGIIRYFYSREHGGRYLYSTYPSEPGFRLIHLNEIGGHLVCHRKHVNSYLDEFTWRWENAVELYAGPNGVSGTADNTLGQFVSPIVFFGIGSFRRPMSPVPCFVYDKNSKCFFGVDFEKQKVYKGPELHDSSIQPIGIGSPVESSQFAVWVRPPTKKYGISIAQLPRSGYLPAVDESGHIYLLNPNTLELIGSAGYLPRPRTPFGWGSQKPEDLLDYDMDLISIGTEAEYAGMVVGSLSRQGMWTSVAVFDKEGNMIETADSRLGLFDTPGGPALTIMKYAFESLHPPVLTLASYFTAYSFEARSTHRALFLMPNSFVSLARDFEGNIFWTFLLVLLLMLPALLFAGVLGLRVARDAAILGLSRKARRLWLLGTLAFGLPAYITYRLTRSKITLVTCANCGKPRRPDMDTCHQCNSPWHVPERTPPAWRVLDGDMVKETKDDLRIG